MTNSSRQKVDLLQERFGLKTAAYLSSATADLPRDISERLRAAREQAVSMRKVVKLQSASSVVQAGSSAAMTWNTEEHLGWWGRIGTVLPLVARVVGLLAINSIQNDNRTEELAEVDSALLTDVLPPAAFADPGFVQFLKASRQQTTTQ